jgi:hypothetical protein
MQINGRVGETFVPVQKDNCEDRSAERSNTVQFLFRSVQEGGVSGFGERIERMMDAKSTPNNTLENGFGYAKPVQSTPKFVDSILFTENAPRPYWP